MVRGFPKRPPARPPFGNLGGCATGKDQFRRPADAPPEGRKAGPNVRGPSARPCVGSSTAPSDTGENSAVLIVMHHRVTPEQIQRVVDTIGDMGYRAEPMLGYRRISIGLVGNDGRVESARLEGLPGVREIIGVSKPYKQVSREGGRRAPWSSRGTARCRGVPKSYSWRGRAPSRAGARFLRSRAGRAIVADPSHGTGVREKVVPMARAAGTAA